MTIGYIICECGNVGSPGWSGTTITPFGFSNDGVVMYEKMKIPVPKMPLFNTEDEAIDWYSNLRVSYEELRTKYNDKGTGIKTLFKHFPNCNMLPEMIFVVKTVIF